MKTEKEIKNRIQRLNLERKVILDDIRFKLINNNFDEAIVQAMKIPKLNAKIAELVRVLN